MVFNATFNNISEISWVSVLLVEKTRDAEENHPPAASHWQMLSHNVVSSTPRLRGFELIGTDCMGTYKSKYHEITTTTNPIPQNYMRRSKVLVLVFVLWLVCPVLPVYVILRPMICVSSVTRLVLFFVLSLVCSVLPV